MKVCLSSATNSQPLWGDTNMGCQFWKHLFLVTLLTLKQNKTKQNPNQNSV